MGFFHKDSIRAYFTRWLIVVITLAVLMFSAVSIIYNSVSMERQLVQQLEKLTVFSKESLSIALWQYNYDYINEYVKSFSLYDDIVYTAVLMDKKTIAMYTRPGFESRFTTFTPSVKFITREARIFHNDILVGKLQLAASRDQIRQLIFNTSMLSIALLLIMNGTIFITIYIMTSFYVFNPIKRLEKSVKKVSSGDLETKIVATGNDEISQLASSFDHMLINLKTITASRDELNREIAKRISSEIELRMERDRAQNYLDITGVMMLAIDKNATITLINKKGCDILGLPEDKIIGLNWFDHFIPPESHSEVKKVFKQVIDSETDLAAYYENEVITKGKGNRLIAWNNTVLTDEKGEVVGTLSSGEDITERKESENRIRQSLKEKEVLLKEIHHRVKNNMQIIQSLLNLQSETIGDQNYKKLLIDSNNRIKSMSLIHETLYRSKDIANLNISDYFNEIIRHLNKIYYRSGLTIDLQMDVVPVNMSMDHSIACGLILNELVSNSLKYAFNDKSTGIISITLSKPESNQAVLSIKDDGCGFNPDRKFDDSSKNLGLKIVDILVKGQLKGDLTIYPDNGTEFCITFPLTA
jgi:PAS domain S-box-containing protein